MKIDQISDGFRVKMSEAGVEDAASERTLTQNTPKDIDCRRVLIQNSRYLILESLFEFFKGSIIRFIWEGGKGSAKEKD